MSLQPSHGEGYPFPGISVDCFGKNFFRHVEATIHFFNEKWRGSGRTGSEERVARSAQYPKREVSARSG